eukprot:1738243-Rhodomonas_salina.1
MPDVKIMLFGRSATAPHVVLEPPPSSFEGLCTAQCVCTAQCCSGGTNKSYAATLAFGAPTSTLVSSKLEEESEGRERG